MHFPESNISVTDTTTTLYRKEILLWISCRGREPCAWLHGCLLGWAFSHALILLSLRQALIITLSLGQKFMVFGYSSKQGTVVTNLCSEIRLRATIEL